MRTKITKREILEVLAENRKKHKEEYDEAIIVYEEKAIAKLQDKIDRIKLGKLPTLSITLPQPMQFLKEYDKVYKMISMSTDDEIELSETEFSQYVLDDWQWKDQWAATNSFYK